MRTQSLHLQLYVPGQPYLCVEQEAYAWTALVALDTPDVADGVGWYDTDVRLARKHDGTARINGNHLWSG